MATNTSSSLLLSSLTSYYQKHPDYRRILYDIVQGTSPLSLRVIDWFVTHYAKAKNILYWINDVDNTLIETGSAESQNDRKFLLYWDYRAQLKSYTKMYFDPFRRHERISYILETPQKGDRKVIETTVGQLNFFRWAFQNHVFEFIQNHLAEIEEHMSRHQKKQKGGSAPLEPAASPSNTVIKAQCFLRFD